MRRIVPGALLALAALAAASPPADDPAVVLKGATVFVGDGRTVANATLVVRGRRIESLAAGAPVPAAAKAIDLAGKRVYPGLIDALQADLPDAGAPREC